jgi:hypothetical protein
MAGVLLPGAPAAVDQLVDQRRRFEHELAVLAVRGSAGAGAGRLEE